MRVVSRAPLNKALDTSAMKLVVYNSHEQYAVSRAELETIRKVLPVAYWSRIHELHLAHSHPRQVEPFEFEEMRGIAYLIVPVKEKTPLLRAEAIRHLLIGLARVKARSRFFLSLNARELAEYETFVSEWAPKCDAAVVRLHESA
jgi:hypothetical protein